ncbi:hypothetical protein [Paenibacillus nasutitermitis]|uniref:Uncharacterized protein n=1 Tax=Paenibacillus nasutitermitis TaxID=1652958 RepID=A0A916YTN6_9BACL|nr:hypothetical protein [Paenibacillus nasutitermitis]GGD59662.1 hypothetical protein GCM10010911_16830 [Paenibacillus nasutitermitis]
MTGENGEIALMSLSRYDKKLLGIAYNGSYKPSIEFNEQLIKKMQEKEKEREKLAPPPADKYNAPMLKVIE